MRQHFPARPSHLVEEIVQNKKMWGTSPTFHSRPQGTRSNEKVDRRTRRVKRTTICLQIGDHDTQLSAGIAGTMREEAIVVAARAGRGRRNARDAGAASVPSDQIAKVHGRGLSGIA